MINDNNLCHLGTCRHNDNGVCISEYDRCICIDASRCVLCEDEEPNQYWKDRKGE